MVRAIRPNSPRNCAAGLRSAAMPCLGTNHSTTLKVECGTAGKECAQQDHSPLAHRQDCCRRSSSGRANDKSHGRGQTLLIHDIPHFEFDAVASHRGGLVIKKRQTFRQLDNDERCWMTTALKVMATRPMISAPSRAKRCSSGTSRDACGLAQTSKAEQFETFSQELAGLAQSCRRAF